MSKPVVTLAAIATVLLLELLAYTRAPEFMAVAAGVPVAVALACFVRVLVRPDKYEEWDELAEMENGPAEMLRRWRARAQMLAERADGTRADWDRYLRPLLAKEFQLSAGVRVSKNRRALESAGIHQFGPELWRWVDPADSVLRDRRTPAPGRAVLDELLRRLQKM